MIKQGACICMLPALSSPPSIVKPFNSFTMNKINFKDCRVAVSEATARPTEQSKAMALKLLKELTESILSLTEVEQPSNGWKLAKKARKSLDGNQRLEHQQARTCVCTTYIRREAEKSYQSPRIPDVARLPEGVSVQEAMSHLLTESMQGVTKYTDYLEIY